MDARADCISTSGMSCLRPQLEMTLKTCNGRSGGKLLHVPDTLKPPPHTTHEAAHGLVKHAPCLASSHLALES